jgi:Leucine-rich repeat (LRR) protein
MRCYLRIPSSFQDYHVLQLAEAVKKSSVKVTQLEIVAPCHAEASLSVLFHELTPSLTQLQVEEPTRELVNCLLRWIGGSTSLTTLALRGGLPTHILSDLVDALLTNTSISVLDLARNDIGSCEMELVAKLIQHSTTLKCLMVNDNRIVNLENISEALQHNTSLRMLSLANNGIRDLKPLAQVLESSNFVLERMYLHCNRFHYSCEERSRIGHYLELNTAGRRMLHGEDIAAGLYPHILARVSDNPSLLFGLVRELPQAWTL